MAVRAVRDEADKQRDQFRAMRGDESQIIDPQTGMHYKPVNVKRVDRFRQKGYELVRWDSKAKLLGAKKTDEGGQQNGDLVLMHTTIEIRNERIAKARDKQKWHESAHREAAKEEINKIARDDARISAHRNIVVDDSKQGELGDDLD